MRVHPAWVVVSLLACAAGAVAAETDITKEYTWEEIEAGKDIEEGIHNSRTSGEFDEWRLRLGVHPGLDRIQLKTKVADFSYPGPPNVETDRTINSPAGAPSLGVDWVLGDFDVADHGWYYALGLDYTYRQYHTLYAIGTRGSDLRLHALGARIEIGYMWYLNPHWRFELAPILAGGIIWNELDLVEMDQGFQSNRVQDGMYYETGGRAALAWHAGRSQSWLLGLELNYLTGYGQTIFKTSGPLGDIRSEARLWWYGFGGGLFYSERF